MQSGIRDLLVMKTTESSFTGYPKCEFTTLPETTDRVLASSIEAIWTYSKKPDSFAKANQHLLIKAGYVEGQVLPAEQLRVLADLPSRDALRGQLVSTLQAPMAQLIGLLNAARRELVYVLEQRGADAAKPQGES